MNAREAFRTGFLRRCAEEGISPGEAMTKVALGGAAGSAAGALLGAAGGVAGTLGGIGTAGLLLGPPMLGYGAGYTLAKATHPEGDEDVEAVKRQEVISEYRRLARRLKRKALERSGGGVL